MATEIEVTFAKSQELPETPVEGCVQVVDESAETTEVEAHVGTQNGWKKITDKDKASIEALENGDIVPKLAENLTPYAEDSGTTQTQPFFLEGTATGNGESRVDAKQVPAYAFLQEKRGNMVCVNQLVQNGDFSNGMTGWTLAVGTSSISGGVCTITSTGGNTYMYQSVSQKVTGHKVLVLITAYASVPQSMNVNWGDLLFTKTLTTSPQIFSEIATVGSGNTNLNFTFSNAVSGENIYVSNIRLVDLTQWFNGNIPAYLLSHPEAFGRYYKGSLAYEPGRLEPATGRYLTSVGRNIWDEEWESGTIAASTGVKVSDANKIRSKNYISITSSTTYYVKAPSSVVIFQYDADKNYIGYIEGVANTTFTTDSTCHYIYFVCGSSVLPQTTYNHDITITEYYTGESGYDKYYPHEVLATIDTGTEQLGAFDYKVPSGLITRLTGSVDLGTLKFYINTGTYPAHSFYSYSVSDIKRDSMLLCADTTIISRGDYKLGLYTDGTAIIVVTKVNYNSEQELKDALSGIIVHYELAEPITEQGTPFQENVPIDDFGQLSWSNTNVPQGNQIFYPVDYKAYEDTLIKYTDGDATSLVRNTDYASYNKGGVGKVDPYFGVNVVNGIFQAVPSTNAQIKEGSYPYTPIVPSRQYRSVFYGLSCAAGVNLASSTEETAPDGTNPGVYPAAAKTAIQDMLGITDLIGDINTVLDSVNGVVI